MAAVGSCYVGLGVDNFLMLRLVDDHWLLVDHLSHRCHLDWLLVDRVSDWAGWIHDWSLSRENLMLRGSPDWCDCFGRSDYLRVDHLLRRGVVEDNWVLVMMIWGLVDVWR